ncbi:MAG: DNRLRE domain-containing protein [Planctomycetes bacterium]|nr:DNRLRE domain-containing protein [Planctomycetota bacterium]
MFARISTHSSLLSLFALLAPLSAQTTINISCAADNTLYDSATGALSNGAGVGLFVGLTGTGGIRRAVLRFDVAAALPANAKVLSATLNVNVAQSTAFLPLTADVHRLTASWGEGTSVAPGNGGGGGLSTANGATWIHRFYSTSNWSTPGGDFAAVPSVTIALPNFGLCTSPPSATLTADVQSWLDTPASNFGLLIKTDELLASTAHRLDSKESTGTKPSLTVTYLVPGQNGTYGTGCPVGSGTLQAAWVGAPTGGNTIAILKSTGPVNSIGADFFALALDNAGVPLLPGCNVYLPLAGLIPGGAFLTDGGGSGVSPFPVPNGFPGFVIHCQAAVLDASPLGFSLSNVASTCLQ